MISTHLSRRAFLLISAALASSALPVRPAFARSPDQVATELRAVYGRKLENNGYQQALAVLGQLQYSLRQKDLATLSMVQQLAAPYADGTRPATIKSPPDLAGHLLFAELAHQSEGDLRNRYVDLVKKAAATLYVNGDLDRPRPPDPGEMSDAVFMSGPLLCEAGALTKEDRYFSAAISYLRAMRDLCLRPDGLYRHSSLCDAAWGRGNGFPAIGVARCLERLPADHPGRGELLAALQTHMTALLKHQDNQGAWHQVIDVPTSYPEYSCTAMIGWTLKRSVDRKWLVGPEYSSAAQKAWQYIERSTQPNGDVFGVCESTGKQKTLDDYLKRKAITGRDDRGGAMGLLFALE